MSKKATLIDPATISVPEDIVSKAKALETKGFRRFDIASETFPSTVTVEWVIVKTDQVSDSDAKKGVKGGFCTILAPTLKRAKANYAGCYDLLSMTETGKRIVKDRGDGSDDQLVAVDLHRTWRTDFQNRARAEMNEKVSASTAIGNAIAAGAVSDAVLAELAKATGLNAEALREAFLKKASK